MKKIRRLDIDEAVRQRGRSFKYDEATMEEIENIQKQDEKFNEIYPLVFGWKKQASKTEGGKAEFKLMSSLPDGRVVFVDRSQDEEEVTPEEPYICLVYKRPKEAFAKILFPQYQPHVYVPPTRLPVMVWRDEKGNIHRETPHGNSYEERIISAHKKMERMGFDHYKVVFRRGIR